MNGVGLGYQSQTGFNGWSYGKAARTAKYIGQQYAKDMNAVKYNSCLKKGEKAIIPPELLATLNMVRRQEAKKLARLGK